MGHALTLTLMMNRLQTFERSLPPLSSLTAEQKALSDAVEEEHRRKVKEMKLES